MPPPDAATQSKQRKQEDSFPAASGIGVLRCRAGAGVSAALMDSLIAFSLECLGST